MAAVVAPLILNSSGDGRNSETMVIDKILIVNQYSIPNCSVSLLIACVWANYYDDDDIVIGIIDDVTSRK